VFILQKSVFLVSNLNFLIHHLKNSKVTLYSETRHTGLKSELYCVCYELQMYSGGGQRKPVHCVHRKHWKPVLDNNVRDVMDAHSGQAFFGNMIGVVHPGSGSRILNFLPILDAGVKKAPHPGSGSATLTLIQRGSLVYPPVVSISAAAGR
jgi:hypothetical protein